MVSQQTYQTYVMNPGRAEKSEGGSLFPLRGPRRLCLDPDGVFSFRRAERVFVFSARFARLTLDSIRDLILGKLADVWSILI